MTKSPPSNPDPCAKPKKKVIEIKAKVKGTQGVRDPSKRRSTKTLKSSTSDQDSLSSNGPVILVRGCHEVELEATTSPGNEPVTWSAKPNENSESPPTITPTDGGKKAILKTDKTGSFSVIAELDGTRVVWNVVFVWVKVDVSSSVINKRNGNYGDSGSSASRTRFKSGEFDPSNLPKYALDAQVDVELIGGGSSKIVGVDQVEVHVLQNGTSDTLTGNYVDGGTALEVPKGGLPVLDATGSGSPFIISPRAATVKPNNTDAKRTVWTGDSPAGSFPRNHKNTGKKLLSISGVNAFETSVASTSKDAPNAITVHAKFAWTADYSGTVDYGSPPAAVGTYKVSGAKTTGDSSYALISSGTGGQDAHDAGIETFEPRFNGGTDTTWTP